MSVQIGLLTLQLHLPFSQSLKDKRKLLNRVKSRVQNQYNASIAEVDYQDKWQLTTLAVAMVGNNHILLEKSLNDIGVFIDSIIIGQAEITAQAITYY
ncbi:MAG: DUF503 domain-containing protein [FCB group bacterium]|nr:DUF503 domain-containing protein [FCB group bacterium]